MKKASVGTSTKVDCDCSLSFLLRLRDSVISVSSSTASRLGNSSSSVILLVSEGLVIVILVARLRGRKLIQASFVRAKENIRASKHLGEGGPLYT
jgi:hypothetical protein